MPELERELRALGGEIAFPPPPDLAQSVAAHLRTRAEPRRRPRALIVALAVPALAVAAALAVPPARSALLDLLGVGGATIERVETQPTAPRDADLALGRAVDSEDAADAAEFDVLAPPVDVRAYHDDSVPGGKVSFVWSERGRRLLLSEFRGEQLPYVGKLLGPRTTAAPLIVRGAEGVWIEGAGHLLVWRDARGEIRDETRRLAGNVLLWESEGVTFRLEGASTRPRAVAIAESLRPSG